MPTELNVGRDYFEKPKTEARFACLSKLNRGHKFKPGVDFKVGTKPATFLSNANKHAGPLGLQLLMKVEEDGCFTLWSEPMTAEEADRRKVLSDKAALRRAAKKAEKELAAAAAAAAAADPTESALDRQMAAQTEAS